MSTPTRIVIVAGSPATNPQLFLKLENLQGERVQSPLRALLTSGLATAVFTVELARLLEGSGVTVTSVSPGLVRTNVSREWSAPMRTLDHLMGAVMGVSAEQGALAPIYLATADELQGVNGVFFNKMKRTRVPRGTYNPQLAKRLWTFSEQLVGLTSLVKV